MKKIIFLISIFVLNLSAIALAQNQVTLVTYYPAPFGMYEEMRVMGHLGVGTTAPFTQVHVDDQSNVGPQITLSAPAGGNPGIIFRPFQTSAQWNNPAQASIIATDNNWSANLRFFTKTPGALGNALVERVTIQNDGNVGVGTTSPQRQLQVDNDVNGIGFDGTAASPNAGFIRFGDNTGWKLHFGRSRESNGGAINTGITGALLTIQDNGNIGINTTAPTSLFHVKRSEWTNTLALVEHTTPSNLYGTGTPGNALKLSVLHPSIYGLYVDQPDNGRNYIGGRLGIGTATPNALLDVEPLTSSPPIPMVRIGDPTSTTYPYTLLVAGDTNSTGGAIAGTLDGNQIFASYAIAGFAPNQGQAAIYGQGKRGGYFQGTSNPGYGVYATGTRGVSAAGTQFDFYAESSTGKSYFAGKVGIGVTAPTYQLQLSTNSAYKPTNGTWTYSSDERLKKNIKTLDGALSKILGLHGVIFEWKDPEKYSSGVQMGLIAQEVEQVFPGWITTDVNGYKNLTVSGFEALTVESIRELKKENDVLRARVEALEAKIKK